jgi:hypothetical protein
MMISYYDIVLGALTMVMWFEEVEQMIDEHCTAYPSADIQEILWRTLVCDCIQVGTRATVEERAYSDSFRKYLLCRTIMVRENPFRCERNFLVVGLGLLTTASWIILSKVALQSSTRLQGWSGLAGCITALGISLWAFARALKSVPMVYDIFAATQDAHLHAKNITPLLSAFHRYHNTRKFFASENGRVGLLPRSASKGDHIFVFPESSIPFVLRRCGGGYRILGDSYMHGMMDGQGHGDLDGFETIDILWQPGAVQTRWPESQILPGCRKPKLSGQVFHVQSATPWIIIAIVSYQTCTW